MNVAERARLALSLVLAVACGAPQERPAPAPRRPNILVVLTDDQRGDSLACMPRMLEALGPHVVFDEHFVTTPVCCPSRATLLTGLYAHAHGVLRNRLFVDERHVYGAEVFLERGNEEHTLARWLGDAGYRTAYFGRYLYGYERLVAARRHVPAHWDDWYAFESKGYYDFRLVERPRGAAQPTLRCYATSAPIGAGLAECDEGADDTVRGEESYSTDVLRDRLLEFLRSAHEDEGPFFAVFAPLAPHAPFFNPSRYEPTLNDFSAEAEERMRACELFDWPSRPPSYLEADVSDNPAWVRRLELPSAERLDRRRRRHAVSLLAVEDAVRAALELLRAQGEEDTIVIFTSDNGLSWGEHRWMGKNCPYDECTRVPLVVRDPALGASRHDAALVANVDLTATIAAYAGVGPTRPIPGASLVDRIRDEGAPWGREEVLTECWSSRGASGADTFSAIRTRRWKYIEYEQETELYDLERDPHELTNLASDPATERVRDELRERLARLRRR